MTDDERGRLTRRSLITKGAAAGGVLWAAPVIESFTSKAAAQSGTTLTCHCVTIFYAHSNGTISAVTFQQGSDGKKSCTDDASCCNGSVTCGGVTYSVVAGVASYGSAGTTTPTANGGACTGQFSISGGVTITGGSSNTILAGLSTNGTGPCTGVCPNGTGAGNTITFSC
jgi:hypothetical protein